MLRPHRILAILLAVVPFTLNAATITSLLDASVFTTAGTWPIGAGYPTVYNGYGTFTEVDSSGPTATTSASAFAQTKAEFNAGSLKVSVQGSVFDNNSVFPGGTRSRAEATLLYRDALKLSSGSLAAGTRAFLTMNLYVPGSTALTNSTFGSYGPYDGNVGFGFIGGLGYDRSTYATYEDRKQINRVSSYADINTFPGSREVSISSWVTFGSNVNLSIDMNALLSIGAENGSMAGSVDYGQSLYFGGINSLVLENGTEITDFSANGSDGFDYKKSYVPVTTSSVPDASSTLVSCLLALGGISLVKLRRRAA